MQMMDHGPTYTLDEALDNVGFGKFQVYVLAYAGLGSIAQAMEVMAFVSIRPSIKSEWKLSSFEESLIQTVMFVGVLIGGYLGGVISDNYGRRYAPLQFLHSSVLYICNLLLSDRIRLAFLFLFISAYRFHV